MTIETIKFNAGQAVAVNTYLTIMGNAFQWLDTQSRGNLPEDSFFRDAVTLMDDKTMDKTDLANEIVLELTDDYKDQRCAYLMGDVKAAWFGEDAFEWLVSVHNQAVATVKTLKGFDGVDLTIVK